MPPNCLHLAIQEAVSNAISEPSFSASLPPLSESAWLKILEDTPLSRAQNDRLEFMGDALMYATLGRQLYQQIPGGTAGLYTSTRAVLHSNATFSRLAEKFDILAVSRKVLDALTVRTFGLGSNAPEKTKGEIKATGDLFETVIGAYYLEHGFECLSQWVGELYAPLIATAKQAFLDNASSKARKLLPTATQRGCVGLLTQKPRLGATPPKGPKQKRKQKGPLALSSSTVLSPVKARLLALTRSAPMRTSPDAMTPTPRKAIGPRLPLTLRITTPRQPRMKSKPVHIDLTLSDDEEDSPTSAKKQGSTSRPPVAIANAIQSPRVDSGYTKAEDSDSDEEERLERMLLSNDSNMDLASSDSD
ncbi:hypothetical protein BDY19DRAFT_914696 [Irpex rosettiformis]|uniref:Uncharacterized protein n=1 Tax=Irpex rosettiformis TaxID=378272 RepID=A0ACB8UKD5_9APHY|nr:hypothetical protein BDY19DRAFT_914696 [Irpex rosettiformis]